MKPRYVVIIVLLLIIIGLQLYSIFGIDAAQGRTEPAHAPPRGEEPYQRGRSPHVIQRVRSYTDCKQYKSESGCDNSKLGCTWSNGSCSDTHSPPAPVPTNTPPAPPVPGSGSKPSAWMGNNDWVLQIKLGTDTEKKNCTSKDGAYSCHYLYATSSDPNLTLVTDHTVDETDEHNPAYQFYLSTKDSNNKFVSWNDQGSDSCDGASGAAHDKGSVVYAQDMSDGVYLQSSNPQWGFWDRGFLNSCDDPNGSCLHDGGKPIHPGIQTNLAQHLLFVKIPSAAGLKSLASLMTNANLCATVGSLPGFTPCKSGCPTDKDYMEAQVGAVSIIAKPRGKRGDDVWAHLNQTECSNGGISVLSYCSPICPQQSGTASIGGVTDVLNAHHPSSGSGKWSALNTDCLSGNEFDQFHSNHSKMGVCNSTGSDVVIIGGNNHSVDSQGPRGGLFVVIKNKTLADTFRCLFK